jgi:alpha-ketoglutarate-dependent taurine dioxygenase
MEIFMVETRALSPHLGVEVTGVGNLLDDAVIAQCLEALKWRGVLLFRGLDLADEAQVAFSRRLGELVSPGGREIFTQGWQRGDLVVWDNTGMPHRALPYDHSSQRTLHRTAVHGEEAFA